MEHTRLFNECSTVVEVFQTRIKKLDSQQPETNVMYTGSGEGGGGREGGGSDDIVSISQV